MNEQLLATLENSRSYTLQVAEAMPEGGYEFRPAETVWNFRELMHHISYGIQWWGENYIKQNSVAWDQPPAGKNKKPVVADLTKAFDVLKSTVQKTNFTNDSVKGFHATLDHITHHRGQAVTYLRCQGITPPEYTY